MPTLFSLCLLKISMGSKITDETCKYLCRLSLSYVLIMCLIVVSVCIN